MTALAHLKIDLDGFDGDRADPALVWLARHGTDTTT